MNLSCVVNLCCVVCVIGMRHRLVSKLAILLSNVNDNVAFNTICSKLSVILVVKLSAFCTFCNGPFLHVLFS